MVDKWRAVSERVRQQPEEERNSIAEMVQRELEDQRWEQSSALRRAVETSSADYAAGDAVDFDDYDRQRRERGQ